MQKSYIPIVVMMATFALVGTTVFALLSSAQTISSIGSVKTVGIAVYKDIACTQKLTSIDWGSFAPGSSRNTTAYIKNQGTSMVVLSKSVGNWNPSPASNYITLGWNREGYDLNAGASVSATLTLTVSSGINGVSTFTFDITITGTEHA